MRIYVAGMYGANFGLHGRLFGMLTEGEKAARLQAENILESYHYIYRSSFVEKIRRDEKKVFLDSGAFSAFTKGIEVDLDAYCHYIHENADIIDVASVLDGIGDPLLTWKNQKLMEERGTHPLPCFHYGEDERYLEWYVDNYDYITIGGMVPISTPQLRLWLDRIWEKYLCDEDGRAKLKVHGFGLTTVDLMERYPWYSVDSSSWVQAASNSSVYLPGRGALPISEHSPASKQKGQHYLTLPDAQREAVAESIRSLGFDPVRLQKEYCSRYAFNVYAFVARSNEYAKVDRVFKAGQIGLF